MLDLHAARTSRACHAAGFEGVQTDRLTVPVEEFGIVARIFDAAQ